MALHSESEMAFLSQESVSIKNSELNEGALVQLENSAKPESTKRAIAYRIKRFQQCFQESHRRLIFFLLFNIVGDRDLVIMCV